MSDVAICCNGLSKRYRIGLQRQRYKTLREAVVQMVHKPANMLSSALSPRNGTKAEGADFIWALDDVSFEVKQGEAVGIIGRNGAGKSTLLKLLSRITKPTRGSAEICGRVGSLLEVGTGFHSELTGRENIFLNGSILGMSRADIQRRFDEIVAFSEVGRFLDTPVKHYSSGMVVRLAFSVAAHLEPEILIIDEVLAVGDARFQQKCLSKMNQVSTQQGCTLLVVSHNLSVLEAVCRQAHLLEDGKLVRSGTVQDVTRYYLNDGEGQDAVIYKTVSRELRWLRIANRKALDGRRTDEDLDFIIDFEASRRIESLHFDCHLVDDNDRIVVHSRTRFVSDGFDVGPGAFSLRYLLRSPKLAPGHYAMTMYVYADNRELFWADNIDACTISASSYFGQVAVYSELKSTIIPEFQIELVRAAQFTK